MIHHKASSDNCAGGKVVSENMLNYLNSLRLGVKVVDRQVAGAVDVLKCGLGEFHLAAVVLK
ncbi:MAG: hypothetical protein SH868_14185 [Bythopirellula sp.]|nr:hypothetical protein [Bythopirellula sp.]